MNPPKHVPGWEYTRRTNSNTTPKLPPPPVLRAIDDRITSNAPKKVWILSFTGFDDATVRQHHRHLHKIVNHKSILAGEKSVPSPGDKPSKSSVIHRAANRGESGRRRSHVEIGPQRTSLSIRKSFLRVDFYAIQMSEVHFN